MCLPIKTLTTSPPLKPQWLSTESYGLVIMLVSAMLFSVMGSFVKLSANAGISSTQLVFIRAIFQLTATIMFMAPLSLLRYPFGTSIPIIKVVLARGVVGSFGFVLFYYSISSLPIGDAITLFSLYPVITLFMARIFLGEKMEGKQVLDDAAKYEEITNYFKERMAQSKKIAASRGKEARIQAHAAKMASGVTTWRQMKGLQLFAHEASHVGNRPFMFGFAVFTAFTTWAQFKFSDESKANSEYWSTFHGTGKKDAHH